MLVYAIIKFCAYCLWCLIGLRLIAPAQTTLLVAVKYGLIRWFLGLGFGVVVAIALGSISHEAVASLYLGIYTPLRVVEWSIMALLIGRRDVSNRVSLTSPRVWLWVAGGIVVSYLTDLTSPEGLAGKFCVGRCLC